MNPKSPTSPPPLAIFLTRNGKDHPHHLKRGLASRRKSFRHHVRTYWKVMSLWMFSIFRPNQSVTKWVELNQDLDSLIDFKFSQYGWHFVGGSPSPPPFTTKLWWRVSERHFRAMEPFSYLKWWFDHRSNIRFAKKILITSHTNQGLQQSRCFEIFLLFLCCLRFWTPSCAW